MSRASAISPAFEAGRLAFEAGADQDANPYAVTTDDYLSWNDGYNQAAAEAELEDCSGGVE